jgi:phosphoenolpyruvate synthase/pyruvate phosphate dikinase
MSKNVEKLSHFSNKETEIAGGKGASLGEMAQSKIPIPEGFIITSNVFDNFLEKTSISDKIYSTLSTTTLENNDTISSASKIIQKLILETKIPKNIATEIKNEFKSLNSKFVAVRSSATAEDSTSAAWAGQLSSFLNTDSKTLLKNISKCWASLFTPRAITYRLEKGLQEKKISVAVIIQKMVESEISGTAFSANILTGNKNQIIIEAGYGLGEAIVSGKITPDNYLVGKESCRILEKNIEPQEQGLYRAKDNGNEWRKIKNNNKSEQKLDDAKIFELTQLIIKIENHYGFPCDIEWAYANNQFYILQCRPITSIKKFDNLETPVPFFNSEEYLKGWEAHIPTVPPTLITDLSSSYHKKWKGITTFNNGLFSDFILKKEANICYQTGKTLSSNFWEEKAVSITNTAESMSKEIEIIRQKPSLSKTEISYMFEKISEMLSNYSIFSENYADGAMENIQKNPESLDSKKIFKILSLKNDLRNMMNTTVFYPNAWPGTIVEKLSIQFNIPQEDLWQYTKNEILDLFDGKYLETQEINNRKSASVFYRDENGNISIFSGDIAKKIIMQFNKKDDNNSEFVKGKTANNNGKGKISGTVRLLKNMVHDLNTTQKYIDSVKNGDIIVSEATEPDLLPAIRKCAAVITNRGGLLSHAAITAREIGICCIVGAKGATTLLKDDDVIEIDQDSGIIRIIKKSS